jgi:glycerate 2-kinase
VPEQARIRRRSAAIPHAALIAASEFEPQLSAARVVGAIARGLRTGGHEQVDPCPLEGTGGGRGQGLNDLLVALDFDTRMRSSRALVIAQPLLERSALERSVAFELASRARQAGVPCYAVAAENALNAFDARMLDLQAILIAQSTRALTAAGRELARLL